MEEYVILRCRSCAWTASVKKERLLQGVDPLTWFKGRRSLCPPCLKKEQDEIAVGTAETVAATNAAIDAVDANADEDWKAAAAAALAQCAASYNRFTADEVWEKLLKIPTVSTHEPAALGPVFVRAANAGIIQNTGLRIKRSRYKQRHRELTIWESLI